MERKKLVDPHFVKKQLREYLDKGFLWWKKGRKLTHKGEKYLNLIGVEKLAAGLNNLTYSFTIEYRTKQKDIGNRDYILRIVDYRNVHKVENEVDRMSQAEELDIPMPDLYIYEDKSDFLQGPFIIMEKIEGLPVMEVIHTFTHKQTKKFLSDLAHALGVLHNVRIDKWDSYYLNKKHLRERLGRRHDFSDYIMHEIKQILRRFKKLQLDKHHNLDIQYLYKWFKGHSPLLGIEVY